MPIIHLLGRVLPAIAEVTIGGDPTVKWEAPDLGLSMEFTIQIEKSRVDVKCTLNRFGPDDFVFVYMRALDLCRSTVNLVAFAQGCGLTVVLDTLVEPSGNESAILAKDDSLPALCTAFKLDNGFDEVHRIVLADWRLGTALRDLILAITEPHVSSVNCARAVEGLKHLIAAPGSTDKEAWERMRQALQIDRPYLQLITDTSTDPRHGKGVHVPGNVTTEITRRSWIIMNRYLEYKKRGRDLSPPDFPQLIEP